ncbi:MAG: hypothetical protein ACJA02_001170, partial [Myxococcota bacterium]
FDVNPAYAAAFETINTHVEAGIKSGVITLGAINIAGADRNLTAALTIGNPDPDHLDENLPINPQALIQNLHNAGLVEKIVAADFTAATPFAHASPSNLLKKKHALRDTLKKLFPNDLPATATAKAQAIVNKISDITGIGRDVAVLEEVRLHLDAGITRGENIYIDSIPNSSGVDTYDVSGAFKGLKDPDNPADDLYIYPQELVIKLLNAGLITKQGTLDVGADDAKKNLLATLKKLFPGDDDATKKAQALVNKIGDTLAGDGSPFNAVLGYKNAVVSIGKFFEDRIKDGGEIDISSIPNGNGTATSNLTNAFTIGNPSSIGNSLDISPGANIADNLAIIDTNLVSSITNSISSSTSLDKKNMDIFWDRNKKSAAEISRSTDKTIISTDEAIVMGYPLRGGGIKYCLLKKKENGQYAVAGLEIIKGKSKVVGGFSVIDYDSPQNNEQFKSIFLFRSAARVDGDISINPTSVFKADTVQKASSVNAFKKRLADFTGVAEDEILDGCVDLFLAGKKSADLDILLKTTKEPTGRENALVMLGNMLKKQLSERNKSTAIVNAGGIKLEEELSVFSIKSLFPQPKTDDFDMIMGAINGDNASTNRLLKKLQEKKGQEVMDDFRAFYARVPPVHGYGLNASTSVYNNDIQLLDILLNKINKDLDLLDEKFDNKDLTNEDRLMIIGAFSKALTDKSRDPTKDNKGLSYVVPIKRISDRLIAPTEALKNHRKMAAMVDSVPSTSIHPTEGELLQDHSKIIGVLKNKIIKKDPITGIYTGMDGDGLPDVTGGLEEFRKQQNAPPKHDDIKDKRFRNPDIGAFIGGTVNIELTQSGDYIMTLTKVTSDTLLAKCGFQKGGQIKVSEALSIEDAVMKLRDLDFSGVQFKTKSTKRFEVLSDSDHKLIGEEKSNPYIAVRQTGFGSRFKKASYKGVRYLDAKKEIDGSPTKANKGWRGLRA